MAMPDILDALLVHLVDAGVVRRPDTAGAAPPLWRDPADGAIAPGEKKGVSNDDETVVSAFVTGEIPRAPGAGHTDRPIVDLHIRTKTSWRARALDKAIKADLAPSELGYRMDWTMGGLYLVSSQQWRPLGLIGSSRAQGFDYVVAYVFEALATA